MTIQLDITPVANWYKNYKKPLLIAGPCSAETELQVLETAHLISNFFPNVIFRAGIWKPRTRPNTFEGIGDIGLDWLKLVKAETGLLTATEVATADHVEKALKAGIDFLWIGARTTGNPFSVQEIADVLVGVDIPVFIKNPIYPDIQLWVGALERINNAGITKIAAIHRGFHSYDSNPFRNSPNWNLAIDLKSICPTLPIICDPSHIAGDTKLIPYISQKAMDMDMDGLMIETHVHPSEALSDAQQQVTPFELHEIISGITIRASYADNKEFQNKLEDFRCSIKNLDNELFEILSKRMMIADQIGGYKLENNITILQVSHWKQLLENSLTNSNALNLNGNFIKDIYKLIHDESIRRQTEVMNKKVK